MRLPSEPTEDSQQPLWICDAHSQRLLAVNDAAVAHFGFSRTELLAMSLPQLPLPEQISRQEIHFVDTPAVLMKIPPVTAQPATETRLRETAARLQLALAASHAGDWSWEAQTDIVTFSERAAEIFGIPPGPFMTWTQMQDLLQGDDAERARLAVERAIRDHTDYEIAYRVRRPADDTVVWVTAQGRATYAPDGTPSGMLGLVYDITQRKRAEEALEDEVRVTEVLNRVGSLLSAELNLDRLMQVLTDEATALCGAQFGSFFYNAVNDLGESYVLYTLSGAPIEAFSRFPLPRNTAVFAPTFRGEGVVRSSDITQDPRYGHSEPYHGMPEGHLPVRSYLALPVRSRSGEILGGLFFGHSAPAVFTERHEHLLVGVAAQAAIAIDNARLYQKAQAEIADRRQAQLKLQESETLFRSAVHSMSEGFSVIGADGRFLLCNPSACEILGLSYEEMTRRTAMDPRWEIIREDGTPLAPTDHPIVVSLTRGTANKDVTIGVRKADGTLTWLLVNSVPLFRTDETKPFGAVASFADITERKRSQDEMQALNQRISRAMRETHHRVKNNLQVMAAMVDMQAMEHGHTGSVPIDELTRLTTHVQTLAIVHDLLTRTVQEEETDQRLSVKEVLGKLLPMIRKTVNTQQLHAQIEDISLTSKQCTALALAANELVSNAFKHGGTDVQVRFTAEAPVCILKVVDNGKGFPAGFDPVLSANTGLQLLEGISRADLNGTITYENNPEGGASVSVVFPFPGEEH